MPGQVFDAGGIPMAVYFDHNATTPLAPEALDAMSRALGEDFGNPSSVHQYGQRAKGLLDDARSAVASLIGAEAAEIVFTGSGTEADNLAVRGAAEALEPAGRRHLVTAGFEHEAVLNTVKALGKRGWRVTFLPVDSTGIIDHMALESVMADDTALVSVMHANNEIGTVQPIQSLARIAHARGALFHTDAVQSAGKIPVDVRALEVDLLSLSAHKINGPKGAGALWIKRGVRLVPTMTGGKHERNRRAGTENVAGIAGFGAAATVSRRKLASDSTRLGQLRDRLERGVLSRVQGTQVNGATTSRVPNTTNISFEGVEAEALLIALDLEGFAVSTGSACSSGTLEPSHVLRAMGLSQHRAQNSIRFSLGLGNDERQVDALLEKLPALVEKLRALVRR
ncbi:MAG TPA: cysteine desulfurase family protein [Vicinamibacterales bacterium]|nr:cysteine desulfurase family protein [Vicinamibacterales bacterium]